MTHPAMLTVLCALLSFGTAWARSGPERWEIDPDKVCTAANERVRLDEPRAEEKRSCVALEQQCNQWRDRLTIERKKLIRARRAEPHTQRPGHHQIVAEHEELTNALAKVVGESAVALTTCRREQAESEKRAARDVRRSIAECRKRVEARRDERIRTADLRPLAELRAIPPQHRLPEEQDRLDRDEARRAALREQRAGDRRWVGPVLSATICLAQLEKRESAAEIRAELEYAEQYGGVADVRKLHGFRQHAQAMDEVIWMARTRLDALKASQRSCNDPLVRRLVPCLSLGEMKDAPGCADDDLQPYLDLDEKLLLLLH